MVVKAMSQVASGVKYAALSPILCVLATSTTLSVLSQLILDMRAVDPSSQLLAWVKYLVTFSTSSFQAWMAGSTEISSAAKRMMLKIGLIDSVAYGLACYGISCGGVAWQSIVFSAFSPTCSAMLTKFWLRKQVPWKKSQAVAIVVIGLIISSVPKILGKREPSNSMLIGMACAFGSALLYSLIGVMYESLGSDCPPHREAVRRVSMVGITSSSLYQLFYTLPSWNNLIAGPFKSSEASIWQALGSHILFGVIFWVHMQLQSQTIQRHGGLGMSMANACKGPIMVVIGTLFLCSPSRTQSCMSMLSVIGSLIIATGVFQWTTAGTRGQQALEKKSN